MMMVNGRLIPSSPRCVGRCLSLLCLPHAGGSGSSFRHWRECLPDDVGLLAVQYPGHQGRWTDPPSATVEELVASLTAELSRSVPTDFALFGHSFGALVAFELAHTLPRTSGFRLRHLFVSGCRPPDTVAGGPIVHDWPESRLLDYLVGLGGVPPELLSDRALIDIWLPIVRGDLRLNETYRYSQAAPLDCPITAFAGEYDHTVSVESTDGWRQHSTKEFQLVRLQTGHFWTPAAGAQALAILGRVLRDLLARPTSPEVRSFA